MDACYSKWKREADLATLETATVTECKSTMRAATVAFDRDSCNCSCCSECHSGCVGEDDRRNCVCAL